MDQEPAGAHRAPGPRHLVLLMLSVVLMLSAVVAIVSATSAVVAPSDAAAASTDKWDPRIAVLAAKVEKLRKLDFEHPVPVDFLAEKAFQKTVRVDESKLTQGQRDRVATSAAQLSAIGLVDHGVNLAQKTNALRTADVLAYYSPVTKRVTVRGKKLDVSRRVTLAHELTHALQDQHFDLQKVERNAANDKNQSLSALQALVEGDAVRVQNAYVEQLSASDQAAYTKEQTADAASVRATLNDNSIPPALEAFSEAPYALGPPMLDVVISQRHDKGVDALFREPPAADAAFLTPTSLFDGSKVKAVAVPKVIGPGEKRVGKPDTFGAFALYLVLALHDDPVVALRVADGWGGDRMVTYRSGGDTCLRAAFVGRTPKDTTAIGGALDRWAAAMPAGSARVVKSHGQITLSSCDVPEARPAPSHSALDALSVAANRNQLVGVIAQQGLPLDVAACTADTVVGDPAFLPIFQAAGSDSKLDPTIVTDLRSRVQSVVGDCTARPRR
jgi:hypothetical protein